MEAPDLFRVRLNCTDHYQATPTHYDPQLRNDVRPSQISKGPKVPVVRIFGSTETGQKVCAHIHGAFPYLYVEYKGSLLPDAVSERIYRLHLSIDHALAVSYRRNEFSDNISFVARITLVKGIPFYGYHVGYRFFLKIYMFDPLVMTRLADLLQQGVIMKQKFQPYEAHLQYLLQFMIDYNLFGCAYLESSNVRFRSPVPQYDVGSNCSHNWHSLSIDPEQVTDDPSLPRASHCSIEVDICVQDITNRKLIEERQLHHDFVERENPLPSDLKLVHSMAGLWKDETKRRLRQMSEVKQGSSPFPPEVLVTMSAEPRQSQTMGWIHEDEYRDQIRGLIKGEGAEDEDLDFDTFALKTPLEDSVQTVLQSVEDLFPTNLMPALGLSNEATADFDPTSSIEVDESKMLRDNEPTSDLFPESFDEEALREMSMMADGKLSRRGLLRDGPLGEAAGASTLSPGSERLEIGEGLLGVCTSGLKAGGIPGIPICEDLLAIAERERLVSRENASQASVATSPQPQKRKRSSQSTSRSNKRARPSELMDPPPGAQSTPTRGTMEFYFKSPDRGLSFSSPASAKSTPSRVLNFGIVKDQNDPHTKLRLSQTSNDTSQSTQDERTNKDDEFFLTSSMVDAFSPLSSQMAAPLSLPRASQSSQLGASDFLAGSPSPSSTFPASGSTAEELESAAEDLSRLEPCSARTFYFAAPPPSTSVNLTIGEHDVPDAIYQDAFYSKEKDVPTRSREYAGREFRLRGNTLPYLADFDATGQSAATYGETHVPLRSKEETTREYKRQARECSITTWEYSTLPPTYDEVDEWYSEKRKEQLDRRDFSWRSTSTQMQDLSQIEGPTPRNEHGFKYSQKAKSTSVEHEIQYMSTMSVEIHVNTRGTFVPNPEEDEIQCVFWAVKSDDAALSSQNSSDAIISGAVVLCADGNLSRSMRRQGVENVADESTELDLLLRLVDIVRTYDPDVLTGYEVHGGSWGYLMERARVKFDYNICDEFSRVKTSSHGRFGKENDRWGFTTTSSIRVTGRHMINVWRAMRGELNLLQYTMENVVWHLLHRRIPHYSWSDLTSWYRSSKARDLRQVLRYYQLRTRLDIEILEANELIPRTSEQARLLGVDFFSVFSRGSQYKVESIMFRIAKPENFLLISPSKKQVGGQNALECLPLVMEPQSAFYNSPLLVLDFQSLYPSVMIAYNYCYSTFLGRISNWRGASKMGFTEYKRQQGLLALLEDYINVAPNGMMYVKSEIRKSLLAKMLTEILETRVMVKSGMKKDKDDRALQQLLNNRQLALKLLANVTYGYTSASFSGRMPCSEIADSIVQTGRETLERAIAYIHSIEKWGAEVVYGDTDSLFVYLKGKTRAQAFDIGEEIAKAITDMNPRPVKLKFEKVYHPCVLLAKKRYVGYKYESRDQEKPEFDAKGIETVRRDGTPAEQMIEEKALRLLFETADLSQIKKYFQRQCQKIMRGKVSIQDFCFAKEVRLGTYSDKGPAPAGALISTRKMLRDARAEPQYGERVPYVVITGAPKARLIDRCVSPEELLSNPQWRLDAEYYISKNLIPPLERIFNLVGASVRQWYDEVPRVKHINKYASMVEPERKQTTGIGRFSKPGLRQMTLDMYMQSTRCTVCSVRIKIKAARWGKKRSMTSICSRCRKKKSKSLMTLQKRVGREERKYEEVVSMCRSCSGLSPLEEVKCDSKDCPVFWTRTKQLGKVRAERATVEPAIRGLLKGTPRSALEW